MPLEVKDLAGLSQPMTKLVEVVSAGIGTLYRPKALRNQADARAYEIKALSRAQAEADAERKDVELGAKMQRIMTALGNQGELVERAKQRLLAREIESQINVEAIADHAAEASPS